MKLSSCSGRWSLPGRRPRSSRTSASWRSISARLRRTTPTQPVTRATDRNWRRSGAVVLNTEAVCAGYGSKQVLRGISVTVQAQEIVAFIGHNGAGKSTLLKAIFGVVPVSSGAVYFKGQEITNRPAHRNLRDGIAYCLQGGQVFGELTVEDNLKLAAEAMDVATSRQ